jgi:hypothetical protein
MCSGIVERDVVGVDGSARFLESARRRFPHVGFVMAGLAGLAGLPVASRSIGGILSWYSIIQTVPTEVPAHLRSAGPSLLREHS